MASLKNQAEETRLQDKLGKQNFHENLKKVFEPVTDTIKITSENLTKTLTGTSFKINQALEKLNDKVLEIMKGRSIIASYLMSPLSKTNNPENTSQFRLVKCSNLNRINGLLIHNTKPINLYNNFSTFRDTVEEFELKGNLLKMRTNKNYNVDFASLADKKDCMILHRICFLM